MELCSQEARTEKIHGWQAPLESSEIYHRVRGGSMRTCTLLIIICRQLIRRSHKYNKNITLKILGCGCCQIKIRTLSKHVRIRRFNFSHLSFRFFHSNYFTYLNCSFQSFNGPVRYATRRFIFHILWYFNSLTLPFRMDMKC